MSERPPVRLEAEGPIGWLILDRPDRMNALSLDAFRAVGEGVRRLDKDPEVRVIVLRAEGRAFCTGIDLSALDELLAEPDAAGRERLRREILELQEDLGAPERAAKPVIAAVHGYCLGAGLDLLTACDIRIAEASATFAVRETKVGLVADVGTLQRLPAIIGEGWFRELALTGRNFTAEEALRLGFVTRVCPDREALLAEARALAGEIAANSPLAVQGTKEVSRFSREHGVRAGLEYVAVKNAALLHCEDLKEALRALQERRTPSFRGT
ncbi:MAG: enoyl-CoA hydratase/isomerase family protein [Deltaproteobacteria bacterium]|nr:enoyl-CoA hydratase/isomerase family protein [Deltaproteobacteria bacterium]